MKALLISNHFAEKLRKFIIYSIYVVLLFILPWMENIQKEWGFYLLLLGAGIVGILTHWKKIRLDKWLLLFLLLLITCSISTIFSKGTARSFLEMLRYLAYFLIIINLNNLSDKERNRFKMIYIIVILINSILLSVVSWSFIVKRPIYNLPASGLNLYYPTFGHNNLAAILLYALPFTLFLCNYFRSFAKKIAVIMLIFFTCSFLSTFSKSGYMTIIFVLGLMGIYAGDKFIIDKRMKRMITVIILSVSISFVFIVVNSYILKYCGNRSYSMICKPLYLDWRFNYFQTALDALSNHPIAGIGLDNFQYHSKLNQLTPISWSMHGENYFLTLWSEIGIFGGIFYSFLMIYLLCQLFHKLKNEKIYLDFFIIMALIFSFVHGQLSVDWYFLSIYLYFWVGAALVMPEDYPINARKNINCIGLKLLSALLIIIAATSLSGMYLLSGIRKDYKDIVLNFISLTGIINAPLQEKIGDIYFERKSFDKSLYFYRKASNIEPDEYTYYISVGEALSKENMLGEAIISYLTAVSLNPLDLKSYYLKSYKLYLSKAEQQMGKNNLIDALQTLNLTIELFPTYQNLCSGKNYLTKTIVSLNSYNMVEAKKYLNDYIQRGLQLTWMDDVPKKEIINTLNLLKIKQELSTH